MGTYKTVDDIVELIASRVVQPNPITPGYITDLGALDAGGIRRVKVMLAGEIREAIFLPPRVVGYYPVFCQRLTNDLRSPLAVIATNSQSPLPPPVIPVTQTLVDADGVILVDDDGRRLME